MRRLRTVAQDQGARVIASYFVDAAPDMTVAQVRAILPAWPQEINRESVQTLADLMQQDGLITAKVDVAELFG